MDIAGIDALQFVDYLAVAVFAVSGALVASRKEMDVFGFVMLGTVTGIGGGSVRDLLLGHFPVLWVQQPTYVIVCIVVSVVTFYTAHLFQSRYRGVLWLDALGLSLFCVSGAERALEIGSHPIVAVIMGVITGTFGGLIRDVIGGEETLLLRKEIYVTAALAGATVFVILVGLKMPETFCWGAGFVACFAVRGSALRYGWSLPTYKSRPGRTPE